MLVPQHPRPVARRRAVPEVSVAWTLAAAITTDHVLALPPRPEPMAGEGGGAMAPIHVSIVYRLGEYLQLLHEYVTLTLLARERARGGGRGRAPGARLPLWSRLALAATLRLIGPPVFWRKKRLMPVCRFSIDERGLVRETRQGTLRVAWDEVVAVHRLANAWLVVEGDGALPLPRRCFTDAQRAAFERLLVSRFVDDTPV